MGRAFSGDPHKRLAAAIVFRALKDAELGKPDAREFLLESSWAHYLISEMELPLSKVRQWVEEFTEPEPLEEEEPLAEPSQRPYYDVSLDRVVDPSAPPLPPLVEAVHIFLDGRKSWEGTAGELLDELNVVAEEEGLDRENSWPTRHNSLGRSLTAKAEDLERLGITLQKRPTHNYTEYILTRS